MRNKKPMHRVRRQKNGMALAHGKVHIRHTMPRECMGDQYIAFIRIGAVERWESGTGYTRAVYARGYGATASEAWHNLKAVMLDRRKGKDAP